MFDFEGFFNDSAIKKKRLQKMRPPQKPNLYHNQETAIRKIRFKLQPPKPTRILRFVVHDPYATDSSDDEEQQIPGNKVKSFECELPSPSPRGFKKALKPASKQKRSVQTRRSKPDPATRKFRGVRKRPWGKWSAEISNPFLRKREWLGTYRTPEEASEAYEKKRLEFEAIRRGSALSYKENRGGEERCNKNVCESEVSSVTSTVLEPEPLAPPTRRNSDKPVGEEEKKDDDVDEELLQQLGDEFDLDFAFDSFLTDDSFVTLGDDFFSRVDDLPPAGELDDEPADGDIPLEDFDFELLDPSNEALSWISVDDDAMRMNSSSKPLEVFGASWKY